MAAVSEEVKAYVAEELAKLSEVFVKKEDVPDIVQWRATVEAESVRQNEELIRMAHLDESFAKLQSLGEAAADHTRKEFADLVLRFEALEAAGKLVPDDEEASVPVAKGSSPSQDAKPAAFEIGTPAKEAEAVKEKGVQDDEVKMPTAEEILDAKLPMLRVYCRRFRLPITGKKAVLVDRLLEHCCPAGEDEEDDMEDENPEPRYTLEELWKKKVVELREVCDNEGIEYVSRDTKNDLITKLIHLVGDEDEKEEEDDPMQSEEKDAWAQGRLSRSKTSPPGPKNDMKKGKETDEDKKSNIVERKNFDKRVGKLSGEKTRMCITFSSGLGI